MTPCERFKRLHCRHELVFDLGGGLGRRTRDMEGMQREREALQVAPIEVGRLFPSRHLGLPRFYQRFGLAGRWRRLEEALASCQGLLGFRQFLLGAAPALTQSKRIALHDRMDNMEKIWHAQACQ